MKVILRSTDLSFIQSAQVALDAQDIPTVVSGENATGLPTSPSTLSIVEDQDFDQAVAVLAGLQRTPVQSKWEAIRAPRAVVILIVTLMLALCGILIF